MQQFGPQLRAMTSNIRNYTDDEAEAKSYVNVGGGNQWKTFKQNVFHDPQTHVDKSEFKTPTWVLEGLSHASWRVCGSIMCP